MSEGPRAVLRLEAEMIPQLRALFRDCVTIIGDKIMDLERGGRLVEPWMNDPVSIRMRDVYNASVMDAPDGGFAMLRAYQAELQSTYEELGRMEAEYRRTEEVNASLFDDRT